MRFPLFPSAGSLILQLCSLLGHVLLGSQVPKSAGLMSRKGLRHLCSCKLFSALYLHSSELTRQPQAHKSSEKLIFEYISDHHLALVYVPPCSAAPPALALQREVLFSLCSCNLSACSLLPLEYFLLCRGVHRLRLFTSNLPLRGAYKRWLWSSAQLGSSRRAAAAAGDGCGYLCLSSPRGRQLQLKPLLLTAARRQLESKTVAFG